MIIMMIILSICILQTDTRHSKLKSCSILSYPTHDCLIFLCQYLTDNTVSEELLIKLNYNVKCTVGEEGAGEHGRMEEGKRESELKNERSSGLKRGRGREGNEERGIVKRRLEEEERKMNRNRWRRMMER